MLKNKKGIAALKNDKHLEEVMVDIYNQSRLVTPHDFVKFLFENGIHRADIISQGNNEIKIVIGHMSHFDKSCLEAFIPLGVKVEIERGDCHWLKNRKKNSFRLVYPAAEIIREVKYVK